MYRSGRRIRRLSCFLMLSILFALIPLQASGEVSPITEIEGKLEGISEEEKAVLEELFTIQQEIEDTKRREEEITRQIDDLNIQITTLEVEIAGKKKDYDQQLNVMKQVLVNYQREGPASYLELLLNTNSLSEFIMSLNIMKDITHNVEELLTSLNQGKQVLKEEKGKLDEKSLLLSQNKTELVKILSEEEALLKEQKERLAMLYDSRNQYEEQLNRVSQMWEECQSFFPDMVSELSRIIGSGYFTVEDLNLNYGIFSARGYLEEERFNQVLSDHSAFTETIFHFEEEQVVIEVSDLHLILSGTFVIAGKSAIRYEVESGTFYDMPLEKESVKKLFENGPLLIDFSRISGDMAIIEFKLNEVTSGDGTLDFVVIPQF